MRFVMTSLTNSVHRFSTVGLLVLLGSCGIQGNQSTIDALFRPGLPQEAKNGPLNSAPIATNVAIFTNKNVPASSTLSASDADSDLLTFSVVTNPSHGVVNITDNTTGAFTYTPNANYQGSDSFTFKANDQKVDSNTATVSVTISNSASAPVASNITPSSFNEDTESGVITLSYVDVDSDLATTCTISNLSNVSVTEACSCDGSGICTLKVTGSTDYNGSASFDYTVTAGGEISNTASAALTISSVNDSPVATSASITTAEDTAYTSDGSVRPSLAGTDVDNDSLTCAKVSDPSHGTVTINSNCSFTYTPAANYNGTDSFTFKVNDGSVDSAASTVSITVTAVNDAPTISNISDTSTNEDAATGAIAFTVGDAETAPASLTVTASSSNTTLIPNGNISLGGAGANRTISLTPASNQHGSSTITVTVDDGSITTSDTFVLTVNPINDAPTLTTVNTLTGATEDTLFTVSYATLAAAANEADVDGDTLSYRVEAVSTGTLTKGGVAITPGATLLSTGESLVWTPAANAHGTINAFTIRAWDGALASGTAIQVQVSVAAVNDVPVANAQSISVSISTPYVGNGVAKPILKGSDADGDSLSCSKSTDPGHGTVTVNSNCSFTYTPTFAYAGPDSFTFTVSDGVATSAAATVSIMVSPDFTDDDDSSSGFAGAAKVGVLWNTSSTSKLILGPDTDCDGDMNEGETVYSNCAELDESWAPKWDSLVSYFKMNESSWSGTPGEVKDSKGSNNGTRAVAATTTPDAKLGAYSGTFNGSSHVSSFASMLGPASNTSSRSVAAWINPSTAARGGVVGIRGGPAAAGGDVGWALGLASATNIQYYVAGVSACSATVNYPVNQWSHLVATHSTAEGVDLYFNGNWVANCSMVLGPYSTFNGVIGSESGQLNWKFSGKIDDLAIWSERLTSEDIKILYSRQFSKYSGVVTSRVMDYESSNSWSGLKWITTIPFGKELTGDADASGSITSSDSETSADYPLLVGSTGSTTDDDLMSGIVGLWRMNESSLNTAPSGSDFEDKSGAGNHGNETGGVTPGQLGMLAGSAAFDGSNDYVSVGSNNFPSTKGSVSFWMNAKSWAAFALPINFQSNTGTSYVNRISFERHNTNDPGGGCTAANSDDAINFVTSDTSGTNNGASSLCGTQALKTNRWYLVTGTWSSTEKKLYIDGKLEASYSTPNIPGAVPSRNNIGGSTEWSRYFNGLIDEVAIWDRDLHEDEIRQLYRRGANRIKYQVRTCTTADCSDNPTWLGSNNTKKSYFSELHNYAPYNFDSNNCSATNLILTGSPSLLFECFTGSLSNLTSQRYFQYRAILESDDTSTVCNYGSGATWCSPELKSVEVKP